MTASNGSDERAGVGGPPPDIAALSDRYVAERCELDPIHATSLGVPGYDDRLTDYSPEGVEARAELDRRTLGTLDALRRRTGPAPDAASGPAADNRDRVAAEYLAERLRSQVALVEAGEHLRALRNIASPVQAIRQVFDLMPRSSVEHWELVGRRMEAVPSALASLRHSLEEGSRLGVVAARRQALECARQARTWAGEADGGLSFFEGLIAPVALSGDESLPAPLVAHLDEAAVLAAAAYGDLATWLHEQYVPVAAEHDPVGRDRYALWARHALGSDVDLDETYQWGWEELARIEQELVEEADRVRPGADVDEAVQILERDDELVVHGEENFRAWLQDLVDRTIESLDGVHFDIPTPLHRLEVMIAPPGGAASRYYTGPTEDFSRPGRAWYPTNGHERFPLWGEMSTAFHEGAPGHHLQIGQVRWQRDVLTRFQRTGSVAGHSEGWALYAERLMDELGYFEGPGYRLGMLRAQVMRAVRVVVDLGMHLELTIPEGFGFHPGERWDVALGEAFLEQRSQMPADLRASELIRYLGWPAQAISYKVGERVWLEGRADAERRHGASFGLRAFHQHALNLGPLGLDHLSHELAQF